MYKIVNYDSFWSHPKCFSDFKTAFMMYEIIGDSHAIIEEWSSGGPIVVWANDWIEMEMNV